MNVEITNLLNAWCTHTKKAPRSYAGGSCYCLTDKVCVWFLPSDDELINDNFILSCHAVDVHTAWQA